MHRDVLLQTLLVACCRRRQLTSLGFEFDDEAAEWRRWYNELRAFEGRVGHCDPVPLADGETFLLFNWCVAAACTCCEPPAGFIPFHAGQDHLLTRMPGNCMRRCSVQRIAKRSRYLTADRVELLDSIGFDWTGADALS